MKPNISLTKVFEFLLIAVIFLTITEIAEAQANPDITQYVLKGDSKALSTALSNGTDPTIKNKNGHTASNFALAYKRFKIYDQLKLAERSFSGQKQNI